MGSIGIWQIAIVAVLVVLLFGRGKISELMGDLAKGIKNFKTGLADDESGADDDEPAKMIGQDEQTVDVTPQKDEAAKG